MKKKWLAVLMAVSVAATLAACGSNAAQESTEPAAETEETAEDTAQQESEAPAEETAAPESAGLETVTEGVLTVATSPDFAPYEFYAIGEDGNPTLAGFDMALAQYVADYMGLELEVIPMDFDGVIS